MKQKISSFIKYRLKFNPIVRAVCKPYVCIKGKKIIKEYVHSKYSEMIKGYKNAFDGKRCFIIGNGPSLKAEDLDRLKGEITFGANRIYDIFDKTDWRPTFYIANDGNFIDENYEQIVNQNLRIYFLEYRNIRIKETSDNIIGICRKTKLAINRWNDKSIYVSEDISKGFSDGYSVTFTAMQLTFYMGFKEIYLLGVDCSYSIVRDKHGKIHKDDTVQNYFTGKTYDATVQNYESTLFAYQKAEEYCQKHNIKIFNATRGGKLESFPRLDFDSLF